MDSSSESKSGCESGWTLYLEKGSDSNETCYFSVKEAPSDGDQEDLSMVSDASSRPPVVEGIKPKDRNKPNKGKVAPDRSHVHSKDNNPGLSQVDPTSKKHANHYRSSTKGKSGSSQRKKQ